MVVRNESSGPNITAGRMSVASANAVRTASSPSTLADIERRRAGIGAYARNMDEPLSSGSARLDRQLLRRLHVHGMKCLRSVLDVQTDRIHHAVSSGTRIGDRPLVVDVGFDRFKLWVVDTEWP